MLTAEDLLPGMVINHESLTAERDSRGIGVVSHTPCGAGCGFLILFENLPSHQAQCTDAVAGATWAEITFASL